MFWFDLIYYKISSSSWFLQPFHIVQMHLKKKYFYDELFNVGLYVFIIYMYPRAPRETSL